MKLFPDFGGKEAAIYIGTIFVMSVIYQIITSLGGN